MSRVLSVTLSSGEAHWERRRTLKAESSCMSSGVPRGPRQVVGKGETFWDLTFRIHVWHSTSMCNLKTVTPCLFKEQRTKCSLFSSPSDRSVHSSLPLIFWPNLSWLRVSVLFSYIVTLFHLPLWANTTRWLVSWPRLKLSSQHYMSSFSVSHLAICDSMFPPLGSPDIN